MPRATAAPPSALRRPIVGVMGSGTDEYADLAEPLGQWLGDYGVHLLTGGGGGVMTAVSRGFHRAWSRAGLVFGILPSAITPRHQRAPAGYPNPWVDVPVYTHLQARGDDGDDASSRNHLNVLTPSAVVVLPGGAGTQSEAVLAAAYGTPTIVWLGAHAVTWALPDGVRRAESFDDVQRFVRVCVGHVSRR